MILHLDVNIVLQFDDFILMITCRTIIVVGVTDGHICTLR